MGEAIESKNWLYFSCPVCRPNGEKADTFCEKCFGSGKIRIFAADFQKTQGIKIDNEGNIS